MQAFSTVWNRRGWKVVFDPELDHSDVEVSAPICSRFCDELRFTAPASQTWVNSRYSQLIIDSKAEQLKLAKSLGFTVPRTIISNNPAAIIEFLDPARKYVVKPLSPMVWQENGRTIILPTTELDPNSLDDELSVRSCPMIYQDMIEKDFELRVVVFGVEVLVVKLHSRHDDQYANDWRLVDPSLLKPEMIEPPTGLVDKVLEFCRIAGLIHASFDFAVTPNGQVVFFEVNEQGQTLWIEQANGDIPVLDMLVGMLMDPTAHSRTKHSVRRLHLKDYV